eukprot:scaffold34693_cov60-Cyclotella_meneghiniana.AAC.2
MKEELICVEHSTSSITYENCCIGTKRPLLNRSMGGGVHYTRPMRCKSRAASGVNIHVSVIWQGQIIRGHCEGSVCRGL